MPIVDGVYEAVVLLGGDARERLEPVRVMRGALLDRPFLHGVGYDVRDLYVERVAVLDGPHQLLVGCRWEALVHRMLVEHHLAVDVLDLRHLPLLVSRARLRVRQRHSVCHILR